MIKSPTLVALFHRLYNDPRFNPAGRECEMFLSKDDVTADNPLGYTAHVTLPWFEAGTALDAAPIQVGDLPTFPSKPFQFAAADTSFAPLDYPAYATKN